MRRTAVNPWSWSAKLGFDQAHLVEGPAQHLYHRPRRPAPALHRPGGAFRGSGDGLNREAGPLPRSTWWRPLFKQAGAADGATQ